MASINKLSIRGIRAFSPEDQEQVILYHCRSSVVRKGFCFLADHLCLLLLFLGIGVLLSNHCHRGT